MQFGYDLLVVVLEAEIAFWLGLGRDGCRSKCMTEIHADPKARRIIAPSLEGLADAVRARARAWTARHRAARAARVANELQALLSDAQLRSLSDAQLERLGLAHRGEMS